MEKYIVQIEFRYRDITNSPYENGYSHISKTITLGIFDNFDDACICGNKVLEEKFESRFELNKNWNKKERFGKNNGAYGTKLDLISNLAYINTSFDFYAKITRLDFSSIDSSINKAIDGENKVKDYLNN